MIIKEMTALKPIYPIHEIKQFDKEKNNSECITLRFYFTDEAN